MQKYKHHCSENYITKIKQLLKGIELAPKCRMSINPKINHFHISLITDLYFVIITDEEVHLYESFDHGREKLLAII